MMALLAAVTVLWLCDLPACLGCLLLHCSELLPVLVL
jgi:hypothetical protein